MSNSESRAERLEYLSPEEIDDLLDGGGWPETFDEAPGLAGARIVYTGREIPGDGISVPRRIVVSYRGDGYRDPWAVHYLCQQTDGGEPTGDYYLHIGTYCQTVDAAVREVRARTREALPPTDRRPRPEVVVRAAIQENTGRVREGR